MEYSKEQIKEFADAKVAKLMGQPKEKMGLNIEVAYYLSGESAIYSEAIKKTNPKSRLFTAIYEGEKPFVKTKRL